MKNKFLGINLIEKKPFLGMAELLGPSKLSKLTRPEFSLKKINLNNFILKNVISISKKLFI